MKTSKNKRDYAKGYYKDNKEKSIAAEEIASEVTTVSIRFFS